ncbi:hypothetical protein HSBAA_61800 [Vreelandella sulfidaeris]|uniref:Uncharacterized protein n=1 Tax=Vreelandella sulfidaeris TaxID=115553 RepID=A0A455UPL3_9GAMM|nr:hypothetical protein HSBAA_61800 [Halomonas sulfidaeris]
MRSGIKPTRPWLPISHRGFAEQDVTFLGAYRYPQQVIFTSFEIDSLDDLENHKIRVTSPEQGAFVEAFGVRRSPYLAPRFQLPWSAA